MMSIEMFVLWVLIMSGIGGYIAWRYATAQYGDGMKDALLMLDAGRLEYEVFLDEFDIKMIEIRIKPYED